MKLRQRSRRCSEFRLRSVVLVEKLVFNVTYEKIGIAWSHFSAHDDTIDLLVVVVGKRETVEC